MSTVRQATLVLCSLALACTDAPRRDDYLDPQLRRHVERLKAEQRSEPTSPANVYERVDVLWDWANAYATTGGALPINLPLDVAVMRWAEADGAAPTEPLVRDVELDTVEDYVPYIDRYIRELRIKDDDPSALGSVVVVAPEPLVADHLVTLELTYTVGSMPMQQGGGVLVGDQWLADTHVLQNRDPAAENYLTVRASSPQAELEPTMIRLVGPHGGQRAPKPSPAFVLRGATLQPGDTLTVVYGDRSGGSPGLRLQGFSTDALVLPLYVDLEGEGVYMTPQWPALKVVGQEVTGVRVTAPSIVAVGEPFTLAVLSEDRLTNRASGPIPSYEVQLDGEPFTTIPASNEPIVLLDDLTLERPGTARFSVRSEDGAIRGTANPIWVEEAPAARVYWGDTHGHTGFAEGQGSAEGYFRYGRDDARLDFVTLSEHDFWLDDAEWRTLQELTRRFTEEGQLIAFLGYEWTAVPKRGGHHNVLFRTPDKDRVPLQVAHRLPLLYDGLRRASEPREVLVIPHAHSAGDWTTSDGDLERLAEIYSEHGSFEYFGNMYLRNGFEVGFVAASDDHRAKPGAPHGLLQSSMLCIPGLAAVLAPEKSADALFDALRARSTYATSGQRILLQATLNGAAMGSRQEHTPSRRLSCRVSGTSPIDRVELIKNGEVILGRDFLAVPLRSRSWLQVGFESSSEVFTLDKVDNPRGYRTWKGTLDVAGARLLAARPVGFDNRVLDTLDVDADDGNRIRFTVQTRGRLDSMLLELDGASPATELRLDLEPGREIGAGQGTLRPPADIPAARFSLRLRELDNSRLEHEIDAGPHTDRVIVQVVDPEAAMDRELEFTDLEEAAPGDYYYVRVTQLDGGRAWSSPFWVGRRPEPTGP